MGTTLEPLVTIALCDRHAGTIPPVLFTVPAIVEDCGDCEVGR